MRTPKFFNLHKQFKTAYHNLCTSKDPPPGVDLLLTNGLKFCLETPLPKPRLNETFERLTKDIRLKCFWSTRACRDSDDYNIKLYKPSGFEPPEAPPPVEQALANFQSQITKSVNENLFGQTRQHNIPMGPRKLLTALPKNKDFIVLPTDKNLGPAILDRANYKRRCLDDHLLDHKTYRRLSESAARRRMHAAEFQFKMLLLAHKKSLPKEEWEYFQRCFMEDRRIPQFYCIPKVHKNPVKYRPIVSCVNSRMGDLSKWLDVQLQRVLHLCPCYLKDSHSLLRKLRNHDKFSPTTVAVTADAESMYTNIDTTHSLLVLQRWFELHAHELPMGYPVPMILKAVRLVMFNNVFQFDDTYWLQLTGTAMGTSTACAIASLYFSYHEETRILPVFAHQHVVPLMLMPPLMEPMPTFKTPPLLLHVRLIDDAFQIWDFSNLPSDLIIVLLSSIPCVHFFVVLDVKTLLLDSTLIFFSWVNFRFISTGKYINRRFLSLRFFGFEVILFHRLNCFSNIHHVSVFFELGDCSFLDCVEWMVPVHIICIQYCKLIFTFRGLVILVLVLVPTSALSPAFAAASITSATHGWLSVWVMDLVDFDSPQNVALDRSLWRSSSRTISFVPSVRSVTRRSYRSVVDDVT